MAWTQAAVVYLATGADSLDFTALGFSSLTFPGPKEACKSYSGGIRNILGVFNIRGGEGVGA